MGRVCAYAWWECHGINRKWRAISNQRHLLLQIPGLLYMAARKGRVEMVRTLVQGGANVDIQAQHERSPLHVASINGHLKVVRALIRAGANVNIQDYTGLTSVHVAFIEGRVEVMRVLMEAGAIVDTSVLRDLQRNLGMCRGIYRMYNKCVDR